MTLVDYVKNCIRVRRFEEEDADEVSMLIVRNFLVVNSKDYKNGVKELDEEHYYRLEKFKEVSI